MTLLLDIGIVLAFAVIAVNSYWWLAEGQVKADIVLIPPILALMCIVPTFVFFYPIRVTILGAAFGLVILMRLRRYVEKALRRGRLWGIAQHYSTQLLDYLEGYELVWVEMYGDGFQLADRDESQVLLFVEENAYFDLIHDQTFTDKLWGIIELTGKPENDDYPDQLVVVLVLERADALPVALPFYATRYQKQFAKGTYNKYGEMSAYSYIWSQALSKLHHYGEVTLFPLEEKHARTLKTWDLSFYRRFVRNRRKPYFFYEHLASLPHTHLTVPLFTNEMFSYFYDQQRIEKMQAAQPRKQGSASILNHHDGLTPGFIQQAVKLSQGNSRRS